MKNTHPIKKTQIALIEVTHFHDECLYSQIQFLHSPQHHITLICNKVLKPRVASFKEVDHFIYLDQSTKLKKYLSWFRIWLYITKNKTAKVIFNTGDSYIYKLLKLPFPKKTEIIASIHNADKLKNNKKTKRNDQKIDKYLTLGNFIKRQILEEKLTHKPVESYYPIFFPKYANEIEKPTNEIWLAVPGAIDFNKRDYQALIGLSFPKNVKIILLGTTPNDQQAHQFIKDIKTSKLKDHFIIFDQFITNPIYHNYLEKSDFILPLLHPSNDHFEKFKKYKISGSYNLAYAHKKPMLMDQAFGTIDDFKTNVIFYGYREMNKMFEVINTYNTPYKQEEKLHFSHQKNAYNNFVFNS